MDNSGLEKLGANLLEAEIKELLRRIEKGEASHQDLEVARKLLADNGITVEAKKGTPLAALKNKLPFSSDYAESH